MENCSQSGWHLLLLNVYDIDLAVLLSVLL